MTLTPVNSDVHLQKTHMRLRQPKSAKRWYDLQVPHFIEELLAVDSSHLRKTETETERQTDREIVLEDVTMDKFIMLLWTACIHAYKGSTN